MFIKEIKGMKKWNNAEIITLDLNQTADGSHCFWREGVCIPIYGRTQTGIAPCPSTPSTPTVDDTTGTEETTETGTTTDELS